MIYTSMLKLEYTPLSPG